MSKLQLRIKAIFFRTLQSVFTYFDLYLSSPLPKRSAFTRRIQSTVSPVPGYFDILFYTPPSYPQPTVKQESSSVPTPKHPLLINFHGGGFTIGNAHDDARWATAVTSQTSAIVASVNYRRAPEHPFPIPIEDCVSSILYLWSQASSLNIDISRTSLSGFSAGGNLCYAVSIRLREELPRLEREAKLDKEMKNGRLVSLAVFYGSSDWRQSRLERDASNPGLIPVIPPTLYRLMDESYLSPKPDQTSPLLSPGIASDDVLDGALPKRLFILSCSGDQLLAETETFRARLKALGKEVEGYVVEGVAHAFDKQPSYWKGNSKRDEAYRLAVEFLLKAWA